MNPPTHSHEKYIVAYDLPQTVSRTFHRRLHQILDEFGGKTQCQATQSVYLLTGERARTAAYAIAVLAEAFGAAAAYVAQIVEIAPLVHFEEMARARQIVTQLTANRRTAAGKRTPRSIQALANDNATAGDDHPRTLTAQLEGEPKIMAWTKGGARPVPSRPHPAPMEVTR